MKVLYVLNNIMDFKSGCHFFRAFLPGIALRELGHIVIEVTANYKDWDNILKGVDVVIFQRMYGFNINDLIEKIKKKKIRIAYDIDDDIWNVPVGNPASKGNTAATYQIENLLRVADVVTTTTPRLKKLLDKFNDNVVVIPNAVNIDKYNGDKKENNLPIVIYSGSASHWQDFLEILPTLRDVKKDIPFHFVLQGFTQESLEAAMFMYAKLAAWGISEPGSEYQRVALKCWEYLRDMNVLHVPFYPPEMYPMVLRTVNADIGICPLEDNLFNKSKSCIKFYEYASSDIVTLAPDLEPYSDEVTLRYNGLTDFKNKLKQLLIDKRYRYETLYEQKRWVKNNRDINKIVKLWEKTLS